MLKKIIVIIIIILIILLGGVCIYMNKNNSNEEVEKSNDINNDNQETNTLILYFSATNNTETIAKYISEITDGDLIEIIPKEKYTSDDLDYNNDNSRANIEQNDDKARPEIANTNIDVNNYDIIYLGYPIWWGDVPKIILTLLDTYDFNGKTVVPFCTSGGSEITNSVNTLKNYNSAINWQNGMRFSASSTKQDVEDWINNVYGKNK